MAIQFLSARSQAFLVHFPPSVDTDLGVGSLKSIQIATENKSAVTAATVAEMISPIVHIDHHIAIDEILLVITARVGISLMIHESTRRFLATLRDIAVKRN